MGHAMTFPLAMTGYSRTYLPPRSLRADVGGPFTAWELFGLGDGPAAKWADETLDGIIASLDSEAASAMGCVECEETGFYASVDAADDDILTGLLRRGEGTELEALTADGEWQEWTGDAVLEVVSREIAQDLAEAIVAGAGGLLRRYVTPVAWLPPSDVVTAEPLSELLPVIYADAASIPHGKWVNLAVVDEIDQGAVLDLVQVSADGSNAQRWRGSSWTPDNTILANGGLPLVRLGDAQLAEVQEQIHHAIVARGGPNKAQQCEYCKEPATKSILHSEGMAYTPVCDEHLNKGKHDAERCTPDGSVDPTNIVAVRDITAAGLTTLLADAPLTVSPDPRAEKLRRYWSTGKGALKIKWGLPGDWRRCYRHLSKYMGLRAKGYCQNLHKRNNTFWTGDRRNRGLLSAAASPEERLFASVKAQRWARETGRNFDMTDSTALADGVYTEVDPSNGGIMNTLMAGGFPVKPPGDWFENPKLTGPTPIDVTDEGRVFGHIAPWGVNHIGMAGSVVTPKNPDGKYTYFRTGVVADASGIDHHVGQLTLVGGHAPIGVNHALAVRHYDDTNSAVADVVVGEDQFGIWAAGALRPNVTPDQVRAMRACPPSGDWRVINGRLELVAACHVNVQGFPIAKAFAASGQITSLVAAGARQMYLLRASQVGEPVLAAKIAEMENQLAVLASGAATATLERTDPPVAGEATEPPVAEGATVSDAVIEKTVAAEPVVDAADVQPTEEELARADKIAAARDQVAEIRRDQLRARVRGSAAVTAALPPQFLAHKKGADGKEPSTVKGTDSFPIASVADLKKAIQAFGRAGDKEAAKKHIISMAYKLKRPDLIPSNWKK